MSNQNLVVKKGYGLLEVLSRSESRVSVFSLILDTMVQRQARASGAPCLTQVGALPRRGQTVAEQMPGHSGHPTIR